ncbi:MAG: hypothetical protein V4615_11295 [Bacteroidota bacterium]
MSAIQFLTQKEIDRHKWDACIARSLNSLPYAFSLYLDSVAENWDALVSGNYEVVMPIVWTRKFGIKCLYQPYYCQQLGVFGDMPNKETYREFLNYVTQRYAYVNINLNPSAQIVAEEYNLKVKKNLFLSLNEKYELLKKGYSENHKRNIRKAAKEKITFSYETTVSNFQKFYLENVNRKQENFKSKHEKIFRLLTKALIENGSGKLFSCISEEKKQLASCMIVRHEKRIINIINTSSLEGKNTGASHFLFDGIIQAYSGKDITLDFEGSSVHSIARFYEGFGAQQEIFYNYHTSVFKKYGQRFSQK